MRAFLAIELPPTTHRSLRALQRDLAATLEEARLARTVRWTSVANIHLTLRFLGETSDAQRAALVEGLRPIAARTAPFDLALRGLGCFPNSRRPNVLWTGVTGAVSSLHALQMPIEMLARRAGFAAEERPFAPHLTLARFRREAAPADLARAGTLVQAQAQSPAVQSWSAALPVAQIVLMQSDLQPSGAVYTPLEILPLGDVEPLA